MPAKAVEPLRSSPAVQTLNANVPFCRGIQANEQQIHRRGGCCTSGVSGWRAALPGSGARSRASQTDGRWFGTTPRPPPRARWAAPQASSTSTARALAATPRQTSFLRQQKHPFARETEARETRATLRTQNTMARRRFSSDTTIEGLKGGLGIREAVSRSQANQATDSGNARRGSIPRDFIIHCMDPFPAWRGIVRAGPLGPSLRRRDMRMP